jgi:hypothetical protein
MIPTPHYAMSAKSSWLCLEQVAELVWFYIVCQQTLTATNMKWNAIIESYYHEYWECLET